MGENTRRNGSEHDQSSSVRAAPLLSDQDPACLTLGEQGRYSYFQIKIVWVNKHSLMYMLVKSLTYYCGRLKPIGWIFHLPS